MENKDNKNGPPDGCRCGMCTNSMVCNGYACSCWGGGWRRGRLLRVVLALVIALFIFWVGVKAGEFRDSFGGRFRSGYRMMNYSSGFGGGGVPPAISVPGMMRPQGYSASGTTSTGPSVY